MSHVFGGCGPIDPYLKGNRIESNVFKVAEATYGRGRASVVIDQ
jgi:hypothetical protein